MKTIAIVLSCVDIVISIALILLVVFQEGNDKGLGVIGGGADTFLAKRRAAR